MMIKFGLHMDKMIRKFVICDVRKLHYHYEKIFESCRNQFQTWLWKSLNKFLLISQAWKTLSFQDPLVTSLTMQSFQLFDRKMTVFHLKISAKIVKGTLSVAARKLNLAEVQDL